MTMKIVESAVPAGEDSYYTEEWYTVVESHLQWLLVHPSTIIQPLDSHDAYKYEADLTGLLLKLGIKMHLHYIVMRLNTMASNSDFDANWTHLAIPSADTIDELMQSHMTITKKNT